MVVDADDVGVKPQDPPALLQMHMRPGLAVQVPGPIEVVVADPVVLPVAADQQRGVVDADQLCGPPGGGVLECLVPLDDVDGVARGERPALAGWSDAVGSGVVQNVRYPLSKT